jgi:hypothetical protein
MLCGGDNAENGESIVVDKVGAEGGDLGFLSELLFKGIKVCFVDEELGEVEPHKGACEEDGAEHVIF